MALHKTHTTEHRIDHLESFVDLIAHFGASQHNLAAHKDQKNDLGLNHAVNEAREELRLIRAEVMVARCESLQTNGELDVA